MTDKPKMSLGRAVLVVLDEAARGVAAFALLFALAYVALSWLGVLR